MKVKTHPLVVVFFVALGSYFIVPLLWLFMVSSKAPWELETSPWYKFSNSFMLFENIKVLFTFPGSQYFKWFENSIFYATTTSLIALLCSALAGYGLAVYKFKGSNILQIAIAFLAMVPANALVLPLYFTFAKLNLIDTAWSVILPGTAFPLGTFLSFFYFKTHLNFETLDAARLDRASEFGIFWRIGLPAATPALAVIFLFSFIQNWNAYWLPMVMLSETNLYTLPVGLATSYGGPSLVVASFVAMLPVMFVFLVLQKQIDINLPAKKETQLKMDSWLSNNDVIFPTMSETRIKPNLLVNGGDGLRAIACLLVMFHHAAQRFNPDQSATWIKALHYAGWRSEVGVALFFVLSGCLLSMPFWYSYVNSTKMPSLYAYARNRIARIVPGVWLSLIVSTYVAVKILGGEFQPLRFFTGLTFTYSFYYKTFFPVDTNGPLWTVGLEAWCYICLPIVLGVIFKFRKSIKIAFVGLIVWILFLQALQPLIIKKFMTEDYEKGWEFGMTGGAKLWMPYWNFATFFTMFLLGSVAALGICVVRNKGKDLRIHWDITSIFALLAASFIVLKYEIPGTPDIFTKQPYMAPWYPALIALALFASAVSRNSWRILDNRLFTYIAKISFGLYLWHWLLLIIVERKLPNDYWSNGANNIYAWLGMITFTYCVTWLIAAVSYRYFESPILRKNRQFLARKLENLS